ncbi:MAG TPA: TCP-1/cpn60 chaperonin family protein [Roseiflexaceae bacterium]|nr:TCP-1/cpn60 chaperonin family protein [Roseiflexaceae bacterium]
MTQQSVPGVVFEARARAGMQRGVNQLVDAVRPTLGPRPRIVAVEHTFRHNTPELLDCAGVIARRIIALPDRDADMGAMLLRNLLWRVHEEAGDATATAAVLFQAVFNRGVQCLAAGSDAMRLRRHLERGASAILEELDRQTLPIQGKDQLAQLAESLCFDEALAGILGEVVDIVGEHGSIEIRTGHGRTTERLYIEGACWPGGALAQQLLADQTRLRSDLGDVHILISDLDLDDPRLLMPLLTAAMQQGLHSVLLVAASLSDTTLAMLLAANRDPERFCVAAVRTPGAGLAEQAEAMEDLALLTGGRRLLKAAGDRLGGLALADLGRARRAWADRSRLGIIGGKGDPLALRRQIASLKAALASADSPLRRTALRERVGRLGGGSAVVTIGGSTESEITLREERARRACGLLRSALGEGVLPGGGAALLACRDRLRRELASGTDGEAQLAWRILLRAVEEPLRTIAGNAGYDPTAVLALLQETPAGAGFDARSGLIGDQAVAGIYDVAAAQKLAVRTAITGAATALTVGTLVHTRKPVSSAGQP